MKNGILLSLRNIAPKGGIFYSLVMRYKKQEKLYPIGELDNAKSVYMLCLKDNDELQQCWENAISPDELEPAMA